MKIPWRHDRCIVCLRVADLTEEHLIPEAIGGRLTVDFLCKDCNDKLGWQSEARAKADPSIALAVHHLARCHPEEGARLLDGVDVVAHSARGSSRAKMRKGGPTVRSQRLPDGSLIQPTGEARQTVERILKRRGTAPGPLAEALRLFDDMREDTRAAVAPGLEVAQWTITRIEPDLSGPRLNPILPAKIAYEFIACHLGGAIYKSTRPLDAVRSAMLAGRLDETIEVDYLQAKTREPLHGIVLEGNAPHARVQVRLFGTIAFRVHFKGLAINGQRFVYTHKLIPNTEAVGLAG